MKVSGQIHASAASPKERAFGTHNIGGQMGPRTCMDAAEKKKISPLSVMKLYIVSYLY
jgi:hypothetical protein